MRVLVILCLLGLCGCAPCGSFQGPAGLPAGEEACGHEDGTSGIFTDDGLVVIAVQPSSGSSLSSDDTFAYSDMLATFQFPKSELVEGATVAHVSGSAFRGLGGQHTDEAVLTKAVVKVGKHKGVVDPGSSIQENTWELDWDVSWGSTYHSKAHDDVDIAF